MAGVGFKANTAQIATGTSEKTLLQIIAATNQRVLVHEFSISFKGTSNTAAPIEVKVSKQTTGGTMSSLTLVKSNDNDDETLQTTATHTATAEPTEGDNLITELVHPQTGYTWQAPYGKPLVIPGGDRLGFIVTAGADVNAVVRVMGEE